MKRFLWWTFTVLSAISAALLVACVGFYTYLVWSERAWLTLFISTPLKTIRPLVAYSILPAAWLIVRARRRKRQAGGFEPIVPVERPKISNGTTTPKSVI